MLEDLNKRGGHTEIQTDGHDCILNELAQGANMMKILFTQAKI